MPVFEFTCMTLKGEWMMGRREAPDAPTLDEVLYKEGLMLMTWAEGDAAAPEGMEPYQVPQVISPEEGRMRWLKAFATNRKMPRIAELAALMPSFGVLGWITAHTRGAIQTWGQALFLIALCAGLIWSWIHFGVHGLPLSAKSVSLQLPPVSQPAMSEKKVKGVRRRTKTYTFKTVRVHLVKAALDHAMRDSSLSSQLTLTEDNALTVRASPLDLELIDAMISRVDQDYGAVTEDILVSQLLTLMTTERIKWKAIPHKTPEPTEEEKKEDEIEKFISNS